MTRWSDLRHELRLAFDFVFRTGTRWERALFLALLALNLYVIVGIVWVLV